MLKNNHLLALILSFLFSSQVISQNIEADNPEPNTLEEAIDNVKRMIQQGSTKKEIAEYVTQTVYNRLTFLNHHWYTNQRDGSIYPDDKIEKKLKYFNIWRNNNIDIYEVHASATWAWENRMGQCNEAANTAFHILVMAYKSAEEIIPVNMENHRYVILGDKYNIPNPFYADDLRKLNNSYVIDPWAGQSFSTKKLSYSDIYQNGQGHPQDEGSYRAYKLRYDRWLKKCKENPIKYEEWLYGTSNNKQIRISSKTNTEDNTTKCKKINPEPEKYSITIPKNHDGTYIRCTYFKDGALKSQTPYVNKKNHGLQLKYGTSHDKTRHPLHSTTNYKNGKRDGLETLYSWWKQGDPKHYKSLETIYKEGVKKSVKKIPSPF